MSRRARSSPGAALKSPRCPRREPEKSAFDAFWCPEIGLNRGQECREPQECSGAPGAGAAREQPRSSLGRSPRKSHGNCPGVQGEAQDAQEQPTAKEHLEQAGLPGCSSSKQQNKIRMARLWMPQVLLFGILAKFGNFRPYGWSTYWEGVWFTGQIPLVKTWTSC